MEFDPDKVDQLTLAVMFMVMSKVGQGGRAWKGFDMKTLERLHQKGWISDPKGKSATVEVSPLGFKKAEALFKKFCQIP